MSRMIMQLEGVFWGWEVPTASHWLTRVRGSIEALKQGPFASELERKVTFLMSSRVEL